MADISATNISLIHQYLVQTASPTAQDPFALAQAESDAEIVEDLEYCINKPEEAIPTGCYTQANRALVRVRARLGHTLQSCNGEPPSPEKSAELIVGQNAATEAQSLCDEMLQRIGRPTGN